MLKVQLSWPFKVQELSSKICVISGHIFVQSKIKQTGHKNMKESFKFDFLFVQRSESHWLSVTLFLSRCSIFEAKSASTLEFGSNSSRDFLEGDAKIVSTGCIQK